jgi:hypothetical protein
MTRILVAALVPLVSVAIVVFAGCTTKEGHPREGTPTADAPQTNTGTGDFVTWSGEVIFETRDDQQGRTDTFSFTHVPWDGNEQLTAASWKGCITTSGPDSCVEAVGQCLFYGHLDPDRGGFALRCHDADRDGPPCGVARGIDICAVTGFITTDQALCRVSEAEVSVYCAQIANLDASVVTGGQERSQAGTQRSVRWKLSR